MAATGVDDDLAYIEHLLDTLQDETVESASEFEDSLDLPGDRVGPGISLQDSGDAERSLETLNCIHATLDHADAGGDCNKLTNLLTRFCEDDDESVLDALLDTFLTSKNDAGMLVEALGTGSPCRPKASLSRPVHGTHLHLQLEQIDQWDSLLDSARDLLQSSRSQHPSPCSMRPHRPPQKPLKVELNCSEVSYEAELACSARQLSNEAGVSSLSTGHHASEAGYSLPTDLASPTARAEFLAKIAEMDKEDHEIARSFVRKFFIGVRSRLTNPEEGGSDNGEVDESIDAESQEDSEGEEEEEEGRSAQSNAISNPSDWSFESVRN